MKDGLRQANLPAAGSLSAPIIARIRLYGGRIWPMHGIRNGLWVEFRPNCRSENQTFQRAGSRRKSPGGVVAGLGWAGLGTVRPPGENRNGEDPQALISPAARGRVPGTQRVELTGPETGGANEANRSGPAVGRNSKVQGGRQQDWEARQGGGLKRTHMFDRWGGWR